MTHPLGLAPLLAALRHAGFRIGVRETERLRRVFALQPDLTLEASTSASGRLRALLGAVLVKSREEQADFERIFQAWLLRAEEETQVLQRPAGSEFSVLRRPVETRTPEPTTCPGRRPWLSTVLCLLSTVAVALLLRGDLPSPAETAAIAPPLLPEAEQPPADRTEVLDPRRRTVRAIVPSLTVIPARPLWSGWRPLALGVLAAGVSAALWFTLGRRRWLPDAEPEPTSAGPPRVFLAPPPLPGPQLLDARQQEALVWGIGRFVAEEPTRRLDLKASVAVTVRQGGIPALRYQRASHAREVWLWLDETAEDSTLTRLAREAEATLQTHGLAVERAAFRGVPERLVTPSGAVFAPREVDERRDLALVAVLTDGRVLGRRYRIGEHRQRIDAVLRDLSHWPRLAFVDFARDPETLAGIIARHQLERIGPAALAAFLGGDRTAGPAAGAGHQDLDWAAACALAPESIADNAALALRRALGLRTSPWALRALRAEAPASPGRLAWPAALRAQRLNWLREREGDPGRGLAPGSLLERALRFWEDQYRTEDQRRADGPSPWAGTPAQQRLAMEAALIRLWRDPTAAVPALYRLHGGEQGGTRLRAEIEAALQSLAPQARGQAGLIRMPWSWEERTATERAMLQAMKLGGGMPPERLRRPGRFWLGFSACTGLAAAALGMALISPSRPPSGPPDVRHNNMPPPLASNWTERSDPGWRVFAMTPAGQKSVPANDADRVLIDWTSRDLPCVEPLTEDGEGWRCGEVPNPPRVSDAIRRSLAVLRPPARTPAVELLAKALLDSGSADTVLLDPAWPERRAELIDEQQGLRAEQQLLVLGPQPGERVPAPLGPKGERYVWLETADWPRLTELLRNSDGVHTAAAVWPGVPAAAGDPESAQLRGLGRCQPRLMTDPASGIGFVRLCPGSFKMGSPEVETGRYPDEVPVRTVSVEAFEIGRTEVTNAQYRRFEPDYKGDWPEPDAPATSISWQQAKAYCERYGYRLPSEAEWEYAARAGTDTRWSFGDDERELGRYAWYSDNADGAAHPVGRKDPNPWGLSDLHGNVWEWVQDCYHENYRAAPADARPWEELSCVSRVLRGGSFQDLASDVHSTQRVAAMGSGRTLGFRCARGSRPQP